MKNVFVETANVKRFNAALSALDKRGAAEACLMVLDGKPGLGKTTALHRWAVQHSAVYVRAKMEWTPKWFLMDLLAELGVAPAYTYQEKFSQTLGAMLKAQAQANVQKRPFAVVIDEADHVSRNKRIMESIRDFTDLGDIVFVLVGMGKIRDNLVAFPQIASRIAQYVRFEKASLDDVRTFFEHLCEVPVADDLIQFAHSVTDGFNREIKEAMATIERIGRKMGGEPVSLRHLEGQALINDRATGAPVIVKAAL